MVKTEMHKDASIQAHFAVIDHFKIHTGSNKIFALDTACALAVAFGDAMALAGATGATAAQLDALNEIANEHYAQMLKMTIVDSCAGSA